MIVYLGNRDACNSELVEADDGTTTVVKSKVKGKHRLDVGPWPEDATLASAVVDIAAAGGIWAAHTHGEEAKPAWVASDSPGLALLLAEVYGCEVREIDRKAPPLLGLAVGNVMLLTVVLALSRLMFALRTNGGIDHQLSTSFNTAAQPAAANWIGLTANATAPVVGDTALTGEIATAGGGLIRAQAVYAHTGGTNTATLTKTFTANGTDALPVTVNKIGIFNASTAGTMTNSTAITAATLTASGDSVTITDTITA